MIFLVCLLLYSAASECVFAVLLQGMRKFGPYSKSDVNHLAGTC